MSGYLIPACSYSSFPTEAPVVMPSKREIRLILLHEFKLGRNAAEATRNINRAWGEGSISESKTRRWFQKFRIGDFRLEDEERRGRHSAVDDSELRVIIEADPFKSTREVAKELNVNHSTIARHLKQIGRSKGKRLREESPEVKPPFLEGWGDEIEIIETKGEA